MIDQKSKYNANPLTSLLTRGVTRQMTNYACERTKLKLNQEFLTKPTLLSGGVKSKLQPGTSILLNINYLSSGAGARIRVPLKSRLTW